MTRVKMTFLTLFFQETLKTGTLIELNTSERCSDIFNDKNNNVSHCE
ncbi:hypothetical protein VIBNISOn1_820037 [Vibrio nigripulchritudo SOn1]|uniref:Uncharacterized protein n=1 Tax=Vibrio nigripulchritudo SOn1 TaxID=1238450 RepID=A0AAV2VX70_9VIBR|nr:hypothetical protein VIBNISOn1_820037 [Vibrio nigripulchritudo SOn1]